MSRLICLLRTLRKLVKQQVRIMNWGRCSAGDRQPDRSGRGDHGQNPGMIDKESFDEWMANPVTEYVLKRVGELAEQNKQKWIDRSWGQGVCDPSELIDLKARSEAAKDLSEIEWSDIDDESPKS